ncbi:glycosyltransferase 87 family protein [Actinoplanes sp. TFC3]|uniref:glycosyltransferase 87 family protein n=1 Tax=Actinoplanes sp. TFC3 TaxID=1710355 RepID=UPI00082BDC9B|nr:glycosyltransferase 87 family protein [Actinoplanes sp. TFC3]
MPAMRTSARPATSRSVVVALACVGILAAITTIAQRYGFSALVLDRGAVRSWLGGTGLYAYRDPLSHLGTALSPTAALLLVPAAFLPVPVAGWLLALAGVGALALALIAHVGPVARRYGRRRWPVVLAAGALALTIEPIRAVLGLGTLDLLVFALVTADLVALRRSKAAAGVGIGLATALSVSSAFFIMYLLITRQRRAALTALATSIGAALVAFVVTPRENAAWFGEVLWRIDRSGPVDALGNQSLAGVLARLYDSSTTPVLLWLSFGMLIAAVGMIRARAAHADGDEMAAFSLVGLTAAIVGPVSFTHELTWVLPAMVVLADAAARHLTRPRRSYREGVAMTVGAVVTYLLFVLAPMWSLRNAFAVNSYALALILLVNALPWRQPPLRGS